MSIQIYTVLDVRCLVILVVICNYGLSAVIRNLSDIFQILKDSVHCKIHDIDVIESLQSNLIAEETILGRPLFVIG